MSDYFVCPICYTELPIDAVICSQCGSDDETGWSEEARNTAWYAHEPTEPSPSAAGPIFWGRKPFVVITLITTFAFLIYTIGAGVHFIPSALLLGMFVYLCVSLIVGSE